MRCSSCGREIGDNLKFCKYCGAPVQAVSLDDGGYTIICKACGSRVKPGVLFCTQCGAPVNDQSKININPNDGNGGRPDKRKRGGIWRIIITALTIISILLIGFLVFYFVRRRGMFDRKEETTTTESRRDDSTEGSSNPAETHGNSTEGNSSPAEMITEAATESDTGTTASSNQDTEDIASEASTDSPITESEVDTINTQTMVGDIVYYGTYEQNNNIADGEEGIEWVVLDEEDDRYLLITSEAIDCISYNNVWMESTWGNCSLRGWLNSTFLKEAFTEEQIDRIDYSEHTDRDGNNTTDQVFIMNSEELQEYFDSNNYRTAGATPYAEAQGVYVYSNGNCWWWVSDAGADPHYARYVNCEGAILEYGMLVFNNAFGVRPAMWVYK